MRIKTFVGTSANAILTHIYTALIALLRQQLFVYRDLWSWLNDPLQIPPGLQDDPGEQLVFALVP
jgi:hypothetical protein